MGSLTTSVTSHGIKWGMINYPGVNIIFLSVHNIWVYYTCMLQGWRLQDMHHCAQNALLESSDDCVQRLI